MFALDFSPGREMPATETSMVGKVRRKERGREVDRRGRGRDRPREGGSAGSTGLDREKRLPIFEEDRSETRRKVE